MRQRIDKALELILAVLVSVMTLDVVYGVVTRYIYQQQSEWTDELARFLMIWVTLLGAAYVSGKSLHISIDILPRYLGRVGRQRLKQVNYVLIILFAIAVFLVGGLRYTYLSFKLGQVSPALQLPVGYVYAMLPFSGLLIVYYKLLDLRNAIRLKN